MCLNECNRQIDGISPTFSKKPSIRQEDDGKRLLFECRIQADPKPTITWFHNGTKVVASNRHKVNMHVLYCVTVYWFLLKLRTSVLRIS